MIDQKSDAHVNLHAGTHKHIHTQKYTHKHSQTHMNALKTPTPIQAMLEMFNCDSKLQISLNP